MMKYPVKACGYLLVALFVSGCATKHDKLETYVGKDVNQAVADLGLPTVTFDMQQGRRDFQWVNTSATLPSYMISASAMTDPEQQFDPKVNVRVVTPMFAGKVIASECLYTLITSWDEGKKSWIVTTYQRPTSGC